MSRDYFAEATRLADDLERDGLVAQARALRDAIEGGSTGSEILMALRFHLRDLESMNLALDFKTRRCIRDLATAIDDALDQ